MKSPVNIDISESRPDPIDMDHSGLPSPIVDIGNDDYTWRQVTDVVFAVRRHRLSRIAEPLAVIIGDSYFEGLDDSYHNINVKGAKYCIDRWATESGTSVKPVVTEYTFQIPKGEYPLYVLEACLWLRDYYALNPSL